MPPRVIVIAGKDPALIDGGSESYLRAYGRAARMAGYDPQHFCVSDRFDQQETEFGIIHRARSPFRPFRGLMVAAHQRFVVDCVDRHVGPDDRTVLIHTFGPWSGVGIAAARRLRRRGIESTVVATAFGTYNHETRGKLRGLNGGRPRLLWVQHWAELAWTRLTVDPSEHRGYTGAQLVLVNYHSVRDIIRRQCGDDVRFRKSAYCSEAAFLREEGTPRTALPAAIAKLQPRHAPLLVCVSRHDPRKGVAVLVQALAALREREIPFRACLVGGGLLLDYHRRLVEEARLTACTVVTGRVPDAYSYLEYADIFVLPSLEEGSGSVSLLEAMQAGAAPVASRVDGVPEDVVNEENALLVEPGDAAALTSALGRLLLDTQLRSRIARGARENYREHFSAKAFADDLRRIYADLGFPAAG